MDFKKRPLAITDVETTGIDFTQHEIIEIGLILVDQENFSVIEEWEAKVAPMHIETAMPDSLAINGFNPMEWTGAGSLKDAMVVFGEKTKDAIFAAHNVTFDWAFIENAFKVTGVPNLTDYHRLDLFSSAWIRARKLPGLERFSVKALCRYFGIPEEPAIHRALNGALCELEVLKKLADLD